MTTIPAKYTFVTVAYVGDRGFMCMQARSIALYVPRDLIEEIIVVENTPPAFPSAWREQLRQDYGALRDLVKFVPASTLATIPEGTAGWFSQQILKLMVAPIVRSSRYLILDAKNHFIFPLTRAHMERNGKPRTFTHPYLTHPLRRYLEPILHYFGLPDEHLKRFLPTTPPFYADTQLVCDMIEAIVKREQRPFEDVFVGSTTRFTEFFMIGAYILNTQRRFEDFYDLSGGGYSIIWTHEAHDDAIVTREIGLSEARHAPLFSVHRGAFPVMSPASRQHIAELWHRRGLFDAPTEAMNYLDDPNSLAK